MMPSSSSSVQLAVEELSKRHMKELDRYALLLIMRSRFNPCIRPFTHP